MNRLRLLLIAGGVLVLSVALALVWPGGASPVTVQFLGYANNTKGALEGQFSIGNSGPREYIIGVLPSEVREGKRWKAGGLHRYLLLTSVVPQKKTMVSWPAPTNGLIWRLPVSYWNPQSDGIRFKFGQFLNRLHLTKGDFYFCPTVTSPPVAPYSNSRSTE